MDIAIIVCMLFVGALVVIALYTLVKAPQEFKVTFEEPINDAPYKLEAPAGDLAVSSGSNAPEGVWFYRPEIYSPEKRKPAKRKPAKRKLAKRKPAKKTKAKKKTRKSN